MKTFLFGFIIGVVCVDVAFGLPLYRAISNSSMVRSIEKNPPMHKI